MHTPIPGASAQYKDITRYPMRRREASRKNLWKFHTGRVGPRFPQRPSVSNVPFGRFQALKILSAIALVVYGAMRSLVIHERSQLQTSHQRLEHTLVCSHQLLNPPALPDRLPMEGSIDAMTAFFQSGGVRCFDIDVIVLSDGNMVASHPRRLKAAVVAALSKNKSLAENEVVLEEYTLESLWRVLGVENCANGSATSCPYPLFDRQVLPHFANIVRGIPGAFASTFKPSLVPWLLNGPLLNIDLKLGTYLTEARVLELMDRLHQLQLEDYVAMCATAPNEDDVSGLDLLGILNAYNMRSSRPPIPVGLVLRDMVPGDSNVDWIRTMVEEKYPQSIRSLVPSFRFPLEWYQTIREQPTATNGVRGPSLFSERRNRLWRLPMTVWTIDTTEEYHSVDTLTQRIERFDAPMVSAVVANNPIMLPRSLQP